MRIILAVIAVSVLGVVQAQSQIPPDKEVILFQSAKFGTVTFLHMHHASLSAVECKTCHHSHVEGQPIQDCHACHYEGVQDAPDPKKAFHLRCTGCHEYTTEKGQKAGPLKKKCKLCHIKPASK